MKKIRLIALVTLSVVLVFVLASCGKNSPDKFYNMDYTAESEPAAMGKEITELEDYSFSGGGSDVAVFYKNIDGFNKYKVLNCTTGTVVGTYSSVEKVTYSVDTSFSSYAYLVTKTTTTETDGFSELNRTYMVYDYMGNLLDSGESYPTAPVSSYINNMSCVTFENVLYKVEENNGLSKIADVPAYNASAVSMIDTSTANYYFDISGNAATVYDKGFTFLAKYEVPSYVDDAGIFVLNNENIVMQYLVELPEHESKYDIFEDGTKYDLVTKIIEVKNGKEKNVNVDFTIQYLVSKTQINGFEMDSMFVDKFENVARIVKIKDKRADYSTSNMETFFIGNDLKLGASGNVVNGQADIGYEKIADNRYFVRTMSGYAIADSKGNIVKSFSSYMDRFGEYFYSSGIVYNSNLDVVKDFSKEDISIVKDDYDSIIIKVINDDGYENYLISKNGVKKIFTYNNEDENAKVFYSTDFGYTILTPDTAKYEHFNDDGVKLFETDGALSKVTSSIYTVGGKVYFFS